jgi:hypothetical protein
LTCNIVFLKEENLYQSAKSLARKRQTNKAEEKIIKTGRKVAKIRLRQKEVV